MDLLAPSEGLIIWQTIIFIILLVLLRRFAWKYLIEIIEKREKKIFSDLEKARQANQELKFLMIKKDKILREACIERDFLLKEALSIKEKIELEALEKSKIESERMLEQAIDVIKNEKSVALNSLKKHIAEISIRIYEKLLKQELSKENKQKEFIHKLIDEFN
ncbi:MAG TPA: F0F1 ATP synthase subunit B [Candidatus Angelobacter sp.]|jgi:F-type H+-transporting ATPase subunit b|nr:F0F1 ATP synthase subunit B [Candidatus Angelobacter sp.]